MAKRPALFLALAFGGGILVQYLGDPPAIVAIIGFLAFVFVAGLLFKLANHSFRKPLLDIFLLGACFSAGMLRTELAVTPTRYDPGFWADDSAEVLLLGEVRDAPEPRGERWRFPLAAHELYRADRAGIPLRGLVLVYGNKLQDLTPDEKVLLRGRLVLADEARNPGAFDYRLYLKAQGIDALFYCGDDSLVWREGPGSDFTPARTLAGARIWVESQLARFSSGQSLALLKGLLIGQRDEIDEGITTDFARTGLVHILSVSGLHTGFIALILLIVVDLLRVPRRWQWLTVIAGLFFYAHLTGLQPPVVRAAIMAAVILIGQASERDANLPNSLGVAAIIILLWQPLQLFQLGFQLSFAAVAGIAYLYRPLLRLFLYLIRLRWRPAHWAVRLLAVSFAAQLATLPLAVSAFGRLPLTAIWGNLVAIPLSFLAIAAGVVACIFAPLSGFMSQAYGAVADVSTLGLIAFTQWLAKFPLAYLEGIHVPIVLLLAYLLALATMVEWRKPARRWLLPATLLLLNVHIWNEAWFAEPKLRLTFFDVNQGDAALLEFPEGRRMLVDAGPWFETGNAGERVLLPFFHRQGIRRLNAVVISHPHADHLGGLLSLLPGIEIDTVYFCGREIDSWLEQRCERLMDSLGVSYKNLKAGDQIHGMALAQIVALRSGHEAGIKGNVNDASVVIKVIFGEISLLFPGDAEWSSEIRMLEHAKMLDSDLLKVGHHGSRTSSTPAFLAAVSPEWAVTSAGRRNRFGHPDEIVMARYDSLGIRMARTDREGAIVFETDGKTVTRLR